MAQERLAAGVRAYKIQNIDFLGSVQVAARVEQAHKTIAASVAPECRACAHAKAQTEEFFSPNDMSKHIGLTVRCTARVCVEDEKKRWPDLRVEKISPADFAREYFTGDFDGLSVEKSRVAEKMEAYAMFVRNKDTPKTVTADAW